MTQIDSDWMAAGRWGYIGSITMDPFGVPAGVHRDEDPWARDAADECCHDRLPGDKSDPCGCWPEEGAVVHRPVFVQTREGAWRRAA